MKNHCNVGMVLIPHDVKRMMENQQLIMIGTANKKGVPNVTPRSAFYVDDKNVYWYEIFQHKSYHNFMRNDWVSVSVVDNAEFSGYQLKGNIKEVTDKELYFYADSRISKNIPKDHEEHIRNLISRHGIKIIQFNPVVLYSLNPVDFEKVPGLLDSDLDLEELPKLEEFSMLDYV